MAQYLRDNVRVYIFNDIRGHGSGDTIAVSTVLPEKKKPKEKAKPRRRSPSKTRDPSPDGNQNVPCQFHFFCGKCTKGSDCRCSHQKKKFEEGPKRSNSSAGERSQNDGVCSFWKKGETGSEKKKKDSESEAGRGVKRKKGTLKHEADTLEHMPTHRFKPLV